MWGKEAGERRNDEEDPEKDNPCQEEVNTPDTSHISPLGC
jgi:hypothetical protein